MKVYNMKKFILITIIATSIAILARVKTVYAANCGGATVCNCGDTVTSNYILNADLTCTGHGLVVGADGITINGGNHTITGDGGSTDYGINNTSGYDNITIQDFANITNFNTGIFLMMSAGSTIQNITIGSNYYGIFFSSSSSNTLTSNIFNLNKYSIFLNDSSSNTLSGNTVNSKYKGIVLGLSSLNTLTGNIFLSNVEGINLSLSSSNILTSNIFLSNVKDVVSIGSTNTYSSNQFKHNANNKMLTYTDVARTKDLNDVVTFNTSMFDLNGNACPACAYTTTTSPAENVATNRTDNNLSSSFTVTRPGTYSMIFTITDSDNNSTERNFIFFVDDIGTQITRYYFREINPTHGQPADTDAKSLLFTPPTNTETWSCSIWVQNSPDEIPIYPLANLLGADTYTWYKQNVVSGAYIGVQRYIILIC
ncbi:hypothetical protein A2Y83_00385 [Candidatus Falkowbacteria bacterium RBG_13_39_14]|uniref:Periplasmic copper-binding protein NosD beta helix domain-containing protein n=1 Tax=Candidatus Falkowbacteria bacterium RBG_13_39_14 TaxID=1797985 RepID=A0A1F5S7I9_9BACT|nr:MAG: hypothetical protein A2Y83_00385 [Candidatus Falkowbacteria bacterium RBG_13_39_14]